MALEVLENKFKLPIDITSAGKVNKELQTEGTFVDKNIAIEVNTPDGVLAVKDSGALTGTITVGQSELISDSETAYPITIDAEAKITDVKVGVETAGFVDSSDVVTVTGSSVKAPQVKKYIKAGSLADTTVNLSAEGVADGVTLGSETNIAPESGFYFKTSATGTAKVGTAGWIPADTTEATTVDKYYPIAKVSLGNTATADRTYELVKGPALISGDYLYINEGYIKDTKISLADLVPDVATVVADDNDLIYKTVSVYDKDGALITGSMQDATLKEITISNLHADSALTGSNIAVKDDNSGFTLTGTATISGDASTGVATTGYATEGLSKSATINGTSKVSTDLAKISIGASGNKNITVTPEIVKDSSSATATGAITTTQPEGHFVAVSADAISGSTEITPTVLSAGYGTSDVHSATKITVTGGSNTSGVYYVPITEASHSISEADQSTANAAAVVSSSVKSTIEGVESEATSILTTAPSGNYLTISATATPTAGKYTSNVNCTSTEGYITPTTKTQHVSATIGVDVTAAGNRYIKIYGGELVGETQSA